MSEFVPLQNECVCEYEHVDIHFMMCIYCHIGSIIYENTHEKTVVSSTAFASNAKEE